MTIKVGDRIPDVQLSARHARRAGAGQERRIFRRQARRPVRGAGRLHADLLGAHLPRYVEKAAELKAKGVDEIVGTSVNDAFVMGAWNKAQGSEDITMLADGNGEFAKALGLTMDGVEVRHGQAQPALFDDRQRWRGRAAQRRGAGRIFGLERRNHARPTLNRRTNKARGGERDFPPCVAASHYFLCEE